MNRPVISWVARQCRFRLQHCLHSLSRRRQCRSSRARPAVAATLGSRTCECAGFTVFHVDDSTAARKRLGIPDRFGSCHTATVGGNVLEGHVPAVDVKRLIATNPKAVGLAVPSMPPGSLGMEMGGRKGPYQVLLIDLYGREYIYAHYR